MVTWTCIFKISSNLHGCHMESWEEISYQRRLLACSGPHCDARCVAAFWGAFCILGQVQVILAICCCVQKPKWFHDFLKFSSVCWVGGLIWIRAQMSHISHDQAMQYVAAALWGSQKERHGSTVGSLPATLHNYTIIILGYSGYRSVFTKTSAS